MADLTEQLLDQLADRLAERLIPRLTAAVTADVTPIPRAFYTLEEAGYALNISERGVRRLASNGTLNSVMLGSRRLIPVGEVERIAKQSET